MPESTSVEEQKVATPNDLTACNFETLIAVVTCLNLIDTPHERGLAPHTLFNYQCGNRLWDLETSEL